MSAAIPRIDVDTASRDRMIDHIIHLENLLSATMPQDEQITALRQKLALQPQEAKILAALMSGVICSPYHLRRAAEMPEDAENEKNQVSVRICALRKKLQPFGISIKSVYGTGHQIPADDVQRLRSLLSERAAA
ncbi:helix-turn-helix domain-containing protein [Mesorhizobium ciceri]|uniref:helix-turn-helix domain-containing protein n=1 Tax=Mesorhizobium TaxID=68287 RepID=UPI00047AE5CE|nr:helix-turn-helix domain-containing protein [Mesorhizobium ciceri]